MKIHASAYLANDLHLQLVYPNACRKIARRKYKRDVYQLQAFFAYDRKNGKDVSGKGTRFMKSVESRNIYLAIIIMNAK